MIAPRSDQSQIVLSSLMHLLTNLSCLEGGCQGARTDLRREFGKTAFLFLQAMLLANEPSFVARELLTIIPYPLRRAVGGCGRGE